MIKLHWFSLTKLSFKVYRNDQLKVCAFYHLNPYKLLLSNNAQQTLRVVDEAFKSFFALIKFAKEGKYDWKKIKIPKYRPKGSLFNVIIEGNSISIREGYLTIPMSRTYTAVSKEENKVPDKLSGRRIKEVKIIPQYSYSKFRNQLKILCESYSMKYVEQEKNYTSKASFLDNNEIPEYDI